MPHDLTTIDEQKIGFISPGIDCLLQMDFGIKCSNSIRRFKKWKQVRQLQQQQQQSCRRLQPCVNFSDTTKLLENSPRLSAKSHLLKM